MPEFKYKAMDKKGITSKNKNRLYKYIKKK